VLAQQFAKAKTNDPHSLTQEDIAIIHLYTQATPFYIILNASLRAEDRLKLTPFFPVLKLLLKALYKLPMVKEAVALPQLNSRSAEGMMKRSMKTIKKKDIDFFE